MTSMSINVKDLYFQFKELTPLHDEPTFVTLQTLRQQMKSNTSSIPTSLGGGGHDFIQIRLSMASYTTLARTRLLLAPTHPGTLIVPASSTQYEISLFKTKHKEALHDYHIYLFVQRSLIQQCLDAIELNYLTFLCNRLTGQVPNHICAFLFQLFQAHGQIMPKHFRKYYDVVASMLQNIDEPIDIIFLAIDNICEIAEMVGKPYTPEQLFDMGYIVISAQSVFRSDLCQWIRRPPTNQTW